MPVDPFSYIIVLTSIIWFVFCLIAAFTKNRRYHAVFVVAFCFGISRLRE